MVSKKTAEKLRRAARTAAAAGVAAACLLMLLPYAFAVTYRAPARTPAPFPVTVDPRTKTIHESPLVDAQLAKENGTLAAAAADAGLAIDSLFAALTGMPWYRLLAAVDAPRIVPLYPGERKEQVAMAFGTQLGWSADDRAAFLAATSSEPSLPDGTFSPGTYAVTPGETPQQVRALTNDRFDADILARYSTSTEAVIPLAETLTIASMIERETSNPDEMRTISGIIWNRLFIGMRLQIDATVQYAKGTSANGWWPPMRPADARIKSPFNTYANAGLPPSPISNPSVAAVLAALNPYQTPCFYYFHDAAGGFHCAATYAEHVALLKKYYGRGK